MHFSILFYLADSSLIPSRNFISGCIYATGVIIVMGKLFGGSAFFLSCGLAM